MAIGQWRICWTSTKTRCNGCLGRVTKPSLLRSDKGLVFTSLRYTALVKSHGLQQEFITPNGSEQNGMVERVIRTLNESCAPRDRFESLQHASRVIGGWTDFHCIWVSSRRESLAWNSLLPTGSDFRGGYTGCVVVKIGSQLVLSKVNQHRSLKRLYQ